MQIRESESGSRYYSTYSSWLQENGVDADPWQWISHPDDVLSLVPRVMQPNADRVPETVRFVGPCMDLARLTNSCWIPTTPPSLLQAVESVANSSALAARLAHVSADIRAHGGITYAAG
ncbi:hypothetical protein [Rhodococcus sp. BP22]|uniref:hypothetical protein n=1 Tax=Rhodococcus sp. BP22 TaxID=2758566 RepID=UPI0016484CE3|nr:hypothetical protein [Rhodococcus sp. BP22]